MLVKALNPNLAAREPRPTAVNAFFNPSVLPPNASKTALAFPPIVGKFFNSLIILFLVNGVVNALGKSLKADASPPIAAPKVIAIPFIATNPAFIANNTGSTNFKPNITDNKMPTALPTSVITMANLAIWSALRARLIMASATSSSNLPKLVDDPMAVSNLPINSNIALFNSTNPSLAVTGMSADSVLSFSIWPIRVSTIVMVSSLPAAANSLN